MCSASWLDDHDTIPLWSSPAGLSRGQLSTEHPWIYILCWIASSFPLLKHFHVQIESISGSSMTRQQGLQQISSHKISSSRPVAGQCNVISCDDPLLRHTPAATALIPLGCGPSNAHSLPAFCLPQKFQTRTVPGTPSGLPNTHSHRCLQSIVAC